MTVFFFCFFLSQILFILPTKLNISAFLLQFLFLLMNYGLKVPRLTQQVCQIFLRNQLSIYPERITNIIIITLSRDCKRSWRTCRAANVIFRLILDLKLCFSRTVLRFLPIYMESVSQIFGIKPTLFI